ncbi:MAG: SCO7613 C-terminal domain-containing membrane protein [Marmoricola sp.]
MAERAFGCPGCGHRLVAGAAACERCGLRLSGPDAGRLWEVDQQLARLGEERRHLVAALRAPEGFTPAAAHRPPSPARRERRALSGQQILLGLGALLLLSAASFFLVVVWIVVGLVGQALIMLALTLAAAAGARWAALRRLPAAAETGAVLTTGLLLIDAWAAHDLGLAGLGRLPLDAYGAAAAPVLAVLLLLADRWIPTAREDRPVRPVLAYRPAASALAALTPWCLLALADVDGDALVAGLALVAVADVAVTLGVHRWLPAARAGLAEAPAALGAVVAAVGFVGGALVIGYAPSRSLAERWVAGGLLAVGVVAPLLLRRGRLTRRAALVAAAVVAGILLMDAPVPVLLALAALAALAGSVRGRWAVAGGVVTALGYVAVALLRSTDTASLHRLTHVGVPHPLPVLDSRDVALMLLPAIAGLALAVVAAARTRADGWVGASQVALLIAAVTALLDAPAGAWTVVGTLLAVGELALAARRASASGGARGFLEDSSVAAAVPYAALAVVAAAAVSAERAAPVLVVLGVAVLVYAACPGRLRAGYLGALLVSAGVDTWLGAADVGVVEAYSLPLAVLLGALGAVQWSRDRTVPTRLVAGPALAVALLPSTVRAIGDGDAVRLAVVTAAAVLTVSVGLSRSWRAPVTVGGTVLVLVAVSQGGPLIGYVPGWVTLGAGGAVLLATGVAWERAVLAGRRAHTWYGTLR